MATATSLRWHCSRACHRALSSCRPWGSRFSRTVPLNKKGSWGMTASWDLGSMDTGVRLHGLTLLRRSGDENPLLPPCIHQVLMSQPHT